MCLGSNREKEYHFALSYTHGKFIYVYHMNIYNDIYMEFNQIHRNKIFDRH